MQDGEGLRLGAGGTNQRSRWLQLRLAWGRFFWPKFYRVIEQRWSLFADLLIATIILTPILYVESLSWAQKGRFYLVGMSMRLAAYTFNYFKKHRRREWDRATELYEIRKIEMSKLVQLATKQADRREFRKSKTANHRYQVRCLGMVACYVRAWRLDLLGYEIFANLLVEDSTDTTQLIVIARDREGETRARRVNVQYPKASRQVAKCFETGLPHEVDDLDLQSRTREGVEYRSILGVPIKDHAGKVLGVVSIDSTSPYHFTGESMMLAGYLQPYIELLRPSLEGWN